MTHENSPEKLNIGIEQPRTGTHTEGGAGQENYDAADVQERLEEDPEEAKNLTDPDHTEDMSTGDA